MTTTATSRTTAPSGTGARPLRVGVLGRGRLGSLVSGALQRADDLLPAWSAGRDGIPADQPVDVAIDVSHGAAVADHLAWACDTGTDLVIGTTGWDPALLRDLPAGSPAGVLVAPNFSLTVALVRRLALTLGRYAARSPQPADLAVSETHHRAKADAPSGTALALADALAEGAARPRAAVQTTSLRLGAVTGVHTVHLATPAETLTLTHEAHTREVFADGALAAARWVHGRPGLHTLDDLAGDVLAPLFEPPAPPQPAPPQEEP